MRKGFLPLTKPMPPVPTSGMVREYFFVAEATARIPSKRIALSTSSLTIPMCCLRLLSAFSTLALSSSSFLRLHSPTSFLTATLSNSNGRADISKAPFSSSSSSHFISREETISASLSSTIETALSLSLTPFLRVSLISSSASEITASASSIPLAPSTSSTVARISRKVSSSASVKNDATEGAAENRVRTSRTAPSISLLAAKNSSVSEPVFSCLGEKERRERIPLSSTSLPRALREPEISFPLTDSFSLFRITFVSSEGASSRREFFANFEEASPAKISKSSRLSLLASPVLSTLRSRIRESSSFDLVRRLREFLLDIPAREGSPSMSQALILPSTSSLLSSVRVGGSPPPALGSSSALPIYCASSCRLDPQGAILPRVFHLRPNSVSRTLTFPSGFDIPCQILFLRNSPPPELL